MRRALALFDPWILRGPFEGRSAERYAALERPGFGDLDERLIAAWAPRLSAARTLLDVGAGPAEFTRRAAAAHPGLRCLALEPSATYARETARLPGIVTVRGRAEALPLAAASVDVAVCLSSIRHVSDRLAALAELRRVVRPGGAAYLVELDPDAERARVERHTRGMCSSVSRAAFQLVVLPACPPASEFEALARRAGWRAAPPAADPLQPVAVIELT
jgi:ubiquinone/menaquinone biosynthesis C-methylase UbiE